jgi:hypothetical protein
VAWITVAEVILHGAQIGVRLPALLPDMVQPIMGAIITVGQASARRPRIRP